MMPKNKEINRNVYAAYKGDNYIMQGTLKEISETLGTSRRNLQKIFSHSQKETVADTSACVHKRRSKGKLRLILLEDNRSERLNKVSINTSQGKYLRLHFSHEDFAKIKAYAEASGLTLQASCLEAIARGIGINNTE